MCQMAHQTQPIVTTGPGWQCLTTKGFVVLPLADNLHNFHNTTTKTWIISWSNEEGGHGHFHLGCTPQYKSWRTCFKTPLELLLQGLFYTMAAIYMWSAVWPRNLGIFGQHHFELGRVAWNGGPATPCMWRARDSVGISKLSANWSSDSESQHTNRMPLCTSGIWASMTFLLNCHR